jgi:hypothetical protein
VELKIGNNAIILKKSEILLEKIVRDGLRIGKIWKKR